MNNGKTWESSFKTKKYTRWVPVLAATTLAVSLHAAETDTTQTNLTAGQTEGMTLQQRDIWENGVGNGFRPDVQTLNLQAGPVAGLAIFGGRQEHDLTLLSVSYGHMWGDVKGDGHWYRGNWELRGEFFGGAQVSPTRDWLVGLTPHLRYNIASGTRWVPYFDAGAGVSATGIGPPDLSGTFEFNLQANAGAEWFVRDNMALTFESGFLHMSCAGIHDPNQGLNGIKALFGVTWFY
jgi:lipid A 3-O-deacylase